MKYWPRIYFWFIGTLAIQRDPCKEVFTKCDHVSYRISVYYNKTGSCYFDFAINTTYEDAKNFCKVIGTNLLTIFSHEEQIFVAKHFHIGKEGRWLALEQQNGVWYWTINGIRSKIHFNNLSRNPANQLTRAITQYNTWKARQESKQYMFICKSRTTKDITLRSAYFNQLYNEWFDVYRLNEEYRTTNAVSCGNICLQVKCCSGFTFFSALRKCQLYQKAPSHGYSVSCPQATAKCYVRS